MDFVLLVKALDGGCEGLSDLGHLLLQRFDLFFLVFHLFRGLRY
jgi:hypothetical protein